MFDYVEKAIMEVMLNALEGKKDSDEVELFLNGNSYAIVCHNDAKSISLHWEDGAITVSNWKKNWTRAVEVFATAIKHDNK